MRIGGLKLALALLMTLALRAQVPPAPAAAPQQPVPVDPAYTEGRRLFDTLDYENAIKSFDTAITALQAGATDPARRDMLASAYEMRARARFGNRADGTDNRQTDKPANRARGRLSSGRMTHSTSSRSS